MLISSPMEPCSFTYEAGYPKYGFSMLYGDTCPSISAYMCARRERYRVTELLSSVAFTLDGGIVAAKFVDDVRAFGAGVDPSEGSNADASAGACSSAFFEDVHFEETMRGSAGIKSVASENDVPSVRLP